MLSGLTILDLSRLMPGPFCTMLLSDLGARIITVESPREATDVTATDFPSLLRGKERVVLNLKCAEGRTVFFRLLNSAHAVIEGFRPGTLARLGVDYASARKVKPAIVYASISAYGQEGPDSHRGGHDINFLARSGLLDLMVPENADPAIPAVQFADMTGAMMAALSLLAAIRNAETTGEGRLLDISMADASLSLAVTSLTFRQNGWPHEAGESLVGGGLACYGAYRTKDGRLLGVGALEAHFFRNLCEALGLDDLVPHQYAGPKQPELRAKLEATFYSRNYDEWVDFFSNHDACVTGAIRFHEALVDPRMRKRGAVRTATAKNDAPVQVLGMPLAFPHERPEGGTIATRGEHTRSVLQEAGYSDAEIDRLQSNGAIVELL
jgi:crotonobetainyl-CoA:carnitine CoA-transferase CaiB-like acyl-CoA transferase